MTGCLYNQLLVISMGTLGLIAAFVIWYFRHGGGQMSLIPNREDTRGRKWGLFTFIALEMAYCLTMMKTTGEYAQLMNILSLTAYYYWVQFFFYMVTDALGKQYAKDPQTVFLLNSSVPVFIILELVGMFVKRDLLAPQAPAYLAVVIFIYIIYMVYVIHSLYLQHSRVYGDNDDKAVVRVFRTWMILLTVILPVHVFARQEGIIVCLPVLIVATIMLVTLFVKRARLQRIGNEEQKAQYEHVRDLIGQWLGRKPNPLQNNSLSMDIVAKQLGIERQQLSEYIYDALETTFAAWLSDQRLRECRRRLLETSDTLSEIAYQCGYADLPTMSKAFKRKYTITPSQYRNHHGKGRQGNNA